MNKNKLLVENLLTWFNENKRPLPFRKEKNPYHIWISEIMAQQTQIETLIPYYEKFIRRFPDIQTLADTDEDTLLKYWQGLGYYSRAKNIHKAAIMIRDKYKGVFPDDFEAIRKLPGIGPYTSGAIASIAFNQKTPAVDGNVLRVITRLNNWSDNISISTTKKKITAYVQGILPDQPGDFNEALMELGAMICTPKSPKCCLCPLLNDCQAYSYHNVEQIPVKTKKKQQKHMNMEVGILIDEDKAFIIKRPEKGLLSNLWAFPIIEANVNPGEAIQKHLSQYFQNISSPIFAGNERHVFTHIIWDINIFCFYLFRGSEEAISDFPGIFVKREELIEKYALPTAFSKLLKHVEMY